MCRKYSLPRHAVYQITFSPLHITVRISMVGHQSFCILHITVSISVTCHQSLRIFHITMSISVTLYQNLCIFNIAVRFLVARHQCLRIFHITVRISVTLHQNLAHFTHCDENLGDMSSKIGGPPHPFPQLPETWTLILYHIPVLYSVHTYCVAPVV
jgi:hypothetical protein